MPNCASNENAYVFLGNIGHGLTCHVHMTSCGHKYKAGVQCRVPVGPSTDRRATGKHLMNAQIRSVHLSGTGSLTGIPELVVHHVADEVSTVVFFWIHVTITTYLFDVFIDELV